MTLTFLLGGAPYFYSTLAFSSPASLLLILILLIHSLVIGLFGLVGMAGVLSAPLTGRLIDNLIPWVATVICTSGLLLFQAVQTGAGGINIAAVVIACFGIDVLRQMQQVSLTTAVFALDPMARSRMNSVILVFVSLFSILPLVTVVAMSIARTDRIFHGYGRSL